LFVESRWNYDERDEVEPHHSTSSFLKEWVI